MQHVSPSTRSHTIRTIALTALVALATLATAHAQAVRVRAGNACGSGSVCGFAANGAYILTNAHVSGTRIGRVVNIDYQDQQGMRTVQATIVAAAYSSQMLTDWAILLCPSIRSGAVWKLSTTLPSERTHNTCGSPRCVWPQTCQRVTTVDIDSRTPLWRWNPNSIGGQSGSSVRDSQNVTKGLLTWSWGGRGAGQTTAKIREQILNRTNVSDPRPADLQEVASTRSETEDGFFAEAIVDLPIWDDQPVDPKPDPCDPVDEREAALRDKFEQRGIDYVALLEAILRLIEIFSRS